MTTEHNQRTRLLASGLLVVTFVVGALVGAAGDRLLAEQEQEQEQEPAQEQSVAEPAKQSREPRASRNSILLDPNVLEELGTTQAQRDKIHAILARRDQDAKQIFERVEPELKSMMKQSREEIRAQLTPAQVTKLDLLIEERRARYHKNRTKAPAHKSPSDSSGPKVQDRDHDPLMI